MSAASRSDCNLAGIGVLVTRPRHQAGPLCEMIAAQGGTPLPFPTLEIAPPADLSGTRALLGQLERFQIAIFISPNAVQRGLALLPEGRLPAGLKIAAVGKGTARELARAGIEVSLLPEGQYDSEALLALPQLQDVQDKHILIVRGEGGRPLLADTLRQRGAQVVYAEVYRRLRPQADVAALLKRWPGEVQIAITTSNDILDNLAALLGTAGGEQLQHTPLIVISERMRIRAQELGCRHIILACGADDLSLMQALCHWAQHRGTAPCSR